MKALAGTLLALQLIIPIAIPLALADDTFSLPAPANTGVLKKQTLWATQYYVFSAQNSELPVPQAYPMLGKQRSKIGAALLETSWCNAALEGTAYVRFPQHPAITLNYLGLDSDSSFEQANCVQYFPNLDAAATMTRTLFTKVPADAPLGLGDMPYYRLVAFRSVAVDRRVFPSQSGDGKRNYTVFFVPSLRGALVTAPDGTKREHDGYLMAVDTGGAIKGNHVDLFTGDFATEFAPHVITSTPHRTFSAFIATVNTTINKLRELHVRWQ